MTNNNDKLPAQTNNNQNLPILTKNDLLTEENIPGLNKAEKIAYLYLIKGMQQTDIANLFGITQQTVSGYVCRLKEDDAFQKRTVRAWEKDFTVEARRMSSKLLHSIKPDKMSEGSKPQAIGILIDKARLIDGESSAIISYVDVTREIKDIEAELERLQPLLDID